MPDGRLAFSNGKGRLLVTDLSGNPRGTVKIPNGHRVVDAEFGVRGTRLWILTTAPRGPLWLHTRPVGRSGRGSSSQLQFKAMPGTQMTVSPKEDRAAIHGVTFARRWHCGDAAIVTRAGRLVRRFLLKRGGEVEFWGWSRDGNSLGYVRSDCNAEFPRETLVVANARGRERAVARESGSVFFAVEWAPDGRHIAFAVAPDTVRLVIVDVETRARRDHGARGVASQLVWAARTKEIVFRQESPVDRIVAVPPEGKSQRVLLSSQEIEAASADGNTLLVRTSQRGLRALLDVATAETWPLPSAAQQRLSARRGALAYFVR